MSSSFVWEAVDMHVSAEPPGQTDSFQLGMNTQDFPGDFGHSWKLESLTKNPKKLVNQVQLKKYNTHVYSSSTL